MDYLQYLQMFDTVSVSDDRINWANGTVVGAPLGRVYTLPRILLLHDQIGIVQLLIRNWDQN